MKLKFREIEVFWAVFKGGSVKEAARLLNVSQPAVSMMLKSAEERFQMRLFERSAGRLQPTPEGRALFAATDSVFLELQAFERHLARIKKGQVGLVRLAATPTLVAALVHHALYAFRGRYPEIRVVIRTVPTEQTIEMVARRDVDFGIAYGPAGDAEIDTEDLGASRVACVFRRDHRLAGRASITPEDLVGESIITYRNDTPLGRELGRAFREAGVDLPVMVESTALNAAYLAERGFGVALIDPMILGGGLFQSLVIRPLEPPTTARVQILTPRGEPLSRVAKDFQAEVRKIFHGSFPIRSSAGPM